MADQNVLTPDEKVLDKFKIIIVTLLGEVPEVGGLLAGLVELLWPEKEKEGNPWTLIKEKTEKLIQERINESVLNRVNAALKGLKDATEEYGKAIKENTQPGRIYSNYVSLRTVFDDQMPVFREASSELLLLPMFTQAANLQLALLKDAVQFGASRMKMPAAEVENTKVKLLKLIDGYTKYVYDTFEKGRKRKFVDEDRRDPFVFWMTLNVVDYVQLWPYFDPARQIPEQLPLDREIFSNCFGPWTRWPQLPLLPGEYPPPTNAHVTRVRLGRKQPSMPVLENIRVFYDGNPGPRMGGFAGAPNSYLYHDIDLAQGELTSIVVDARADSGVWDLQFRFGPGGETAGFPVPDGHYLSSIYAVSRFNDATRGFLHNDLLRTVWFGFRYKPDALRKKAG
jgi:hypothetical protein